MSESRAVVGVPATAPNLAPPDYAGDPTDAAPRTGPAAVPIRLSEPVRIYLYSVLTVVVAGLALAGVLTGDWVTYAITAGGVVLAVAGGTEAARASVYAPATVLRLLARTGGISNAAAVAKALDL